MRHLLHDPHGPLATSPDGCYHVAISMGVGLAIAGVAAGGATVAAAKMGTSAVNKSGELQTQSANEALAFERERDARDYAQYQKEYARQQQLEDDDRAFRDAMRADEMAFRNEGRAIDVGRFNAKEGRLTPYRNFGGQGLATLQPLLKAGPGGTSPLAPRR
jgi:hypothetical protein